MLTLKCSVLVLVPNAMPTAVYMKTLGKAKSGQKCSIFLLVYLRFMLRFRMLPFIFGTVALLNIH